MPPRVDERHRRRTRKRAVCRDRSAVPRPEGALLGHLGSKLEELFGERYQGLVLYGSYARGEVDDGSGVDLLLLLEGGVDLVRELLRAQEVKWPLALEAGYTVSLVPVSVEDYERSQKPLLWNARREGIPAALEGGRGPTREGGTVLRRRRTVAQGR
jgi:predicted nucleotidyltransferase